MKLKLTFIASSALILTACANPGTLMETDNQARTRMKMSPQATMDALAPKTQETLDLGPKIERKSTDELDAQRRQFIDKSKRTEDGNWKPFNVTLNFVDVDIREFAQAMTQLSGVNVLVGDDVEGTVTIKLDNVPWDKGLDNILKTKGWAKSVDPEANIIRIHKPETVTTLNEFERKRLEEIKKQVDAKRIITTQRTEIFKLYYTKPDKLKTQLETIFNGTVSGTRVPGTVVEITPDQRTNSIVVKGTESEMELAAKLIAKLDVRTQEVLVEAFVVEAGDNWQRDLGTRLGYASASTAGNTYTMAGGIAGGPNKGPGNMTLGTPEGSFFNAPVTGAPFGFGYLFGTSSNQLKVELTAMEKLDLLKIVSNPHVFTMDNEEAVVIDGVQIPYPVPGVGTNQITYEFKDAALKLTATPTIVGDGNIFLNMVVNKDSPDYSTNPPAIRKREVRSKLLLKDGAIAVIGGIISKTQDKNVTKIPLLGDIPFLGNLFKYTSVKEEKSELLVFIVVTMLN